MSLFFGAETENLDLANAYVLGLCWDGSSSVRRGSAKAPGVIRDHTSSKLYNSFTEEGVDIKERWQIFDLGDKCPTSIANAVHTVRDLISNGTKIRLSIFLGGDHSITYATLKALKEVSNRNWGLLYFDAHPDLYEIYDENPYSHACTVRRLVDQKVVDPQHIVQVGVRAATAKQLDYAQSRGVTILSTANVCNLDSEETAKIIEESLNDVDSVYISLDVDVLDPAFAPGVGNPEGGGITLRKLIEIIQQLKKLRVKAFDVVEANPDYDCVGVTFYSVSKFIREMLGAIAVHND